MSAPVRRSTFERPNLGRRIQHSIDWIEAVCVLLVCLAAWTIVLVGLNIATDEPSTNVPQCTDEIADAGGICRGEPAQPGNWFDDLALPPCEYEGSDNCYWDAPTMGNGRGDSYYVVNDVVTYVSEPGQ